MGAIYLSKHIFFNLKAKIKREKEMLGSDRSICLKIFNSMALKASLKYYIGIGPEDKMVIITDKYPSIIYTTSLKMSKLVKPPKANRSKKE